MQLLPTDSKRRRWAFAVAIYLASGLAFAAAAGTDRLTEHTPYNHYALLADAWLHGRLDLRDGPPAYAQNNDFAVFRGKTYVSFPPFPALLMVPFVKLAGTPENFRDGQFVVWLAGAAPALLFIVLEALRRAGRSRRSELSNVVFAALFAFGTVYFFTAAEGTVWFAAMVIGAALEVLYVLFSIDGRRPALAGAALACAYMTRPPILLAAPFFALESARACCADFPEQAGLGGQLGALLGRARKRALLGKWAAFAAPILVAFAISAVLNHARYENWSPFEPGHEYLTVAWRARMMKWGVESYHYLAKNLGVMLTSLPWLPPPPSQGHFTSFATANAPFQINEHGLALWFTTPFYLWLLWPKDRGFLHFAVVMGAVLPIAMDLAYQNTGWRQFGYRFSNDYAVLLFVLLAIGGRKLGRGFAVAALWSVAWNLFGAVTFDHPQFSRFYFTDPSQAILYQPD
jgi:hypothetical protein